MPNTESNETQVEVIIPVTKNELLEKYLKAPYAEDAPIVTIGRFTLSECRTDENGKRWIWIDDNQEDAGEFLADLLEAHIEEFYNKHF